MLQKKGPKMALVGTFLITCLLIGFIDADAAEKDFEFAEEKESFQDDEDFLADEAGSGSGEIPGVPALYRATINITSVTYSAEIAAAGRDIQSLTIVRDLEAALQKLLDTLPGLIRVRIVSLSAGSLMVTFDIDTDGRQSQEEIARLLKDMLNSGNFDGYRVSPDGFSLVKVRDEYTCPPSIGRIPDQFLSGGNNWGNLMVSNAFPCDGYVLSWRYYRALGFGTVYIGVFRQTSDTEFTLIGKTLLPEGVGEQVYEPDPPILVRRGDFIGVFHSRNTRGDIIAQSADDVPSGQVRQNFYVSFFDEDIQQGVPFNINDYVNSENQAMYAIQADMSYLSVPAATEAPRLTCSPDEWTCRNGDCVDGAYRCDGQVDCYDGSDEEKCPPGLSCQENEFRCGNNEQCIPLEFVCNFVTDCSDSSDERNCGPGKVVILAGRESVEATRFVLTWTPPPDGGEAIIAYTIKYRQVTVRSQRTPDGDYIPERAMTEFVLVELPPTADRYELRNLQAGSYYEAELTAQNVNGESPAASFIFKTADVGCGPGQWQCADGQCINVAGRCDSIPDCEDESDEKECGITVCNEGLIACPQPDGSVTCVQDTIGCVARCRESEFQCLDGKRCISFLSLCNGIVDCEDFSDEANCDCASGEFQCVSDRRCIPESRRCDNRRDCRDGSDEANCPCPEGTFTCLNTRSQECVASVLLCDGSNDCSDGSDEANCGCAAGLWQCADSSCIPETMRCDGRPQCEDSSDEINCRVTCRPDQFTCSDGNCIEGFMKCDGVEQCEDASDEEDCPCREGMFRCRDGNCVEGRMRCDGIPQCEDRSDEFACPTTAPPNCPPSDFQCLTPGRLECIDRRLVCDGAWDCSDASDERDCPGCGRNEFTCVSDQRCIPADGRCNGIIECSDRSDELNCTCTEEQFRCGDGICIDIRRRCDRRIDCNDRSDEIACPCQSGEFQCVSGDCIPSGERCDGKYDCRDRSDEEGCPSRRRCPEGFFQCGTGHCLSENRVCDGLSDCPDGSDEENENCQRTLVCAEGEMKCEVDNKCIPRSQICNRVYDCSDGRDEFECSRCRSDEFQCRGDRSCISRAGYCNGIRECSDGSDEVGCPTRPPISIEVSPRNLRIRQGAEAIITCIAQGLPVTASLRWTRRNQGLPVQSAVEAGKLMIPVAKVEDSGDYVCSVVGVAGSYQDVARLEVVAIGPTPRPDGGDGRCSRDEAVCQNGQCIRREYRCDGEPDCEDGSDEPPDCFNNLCEPNEFKCPNGQCVMKIWRCDGEDDCSDGFDERNCAARDPDAPCAFDEFQCVSGEQCIPLAYQCDQEIDCLDRSDEIGCSAPVITVPPVGEIEVELGETFTILCEAVGVPTPLIVWRLNWGNIPSGERVTVVSQDGRGTLTITDVRYTDAGAYTCEAINNRGSIFAIPDALVIVRLGGRTPPEKEKVSNVVISGGRRPGKRVSQKIVRIGGGSVPEIIQEERTVLIGFDGQCQSNLDVSVSGSIVYSNCRGTKRRVVIEYVGPEKVDVEVAKQIVVLEKRGDQLPEQLRDEVFVHIGGLPEYIKREVQQVRVITGITSEQPATEQRVIELGGSGEDGFSQRKQIIMIGVSQKCDGLLRLTPDRGRKLLQCQLNRTRDITIEGKTDTVDTTLERTVEVIGAGGRVVEDTRQREVVIQGGSAPEITKATQDIVIQGKSVSEKETLLIGKIADRPSVDSVKPVVFGKGPAGDSIYGKIIEISGGAGASIKEEKKYVEIGTGSSCESQLQVSLTGSTLSCLCDNRGIKVQYIGKGPTDLEIMHRSFIIEGSGGMPKFQNQDFLMVYIGGIPEKMKSHTETVVVTDIFSQEELSKQRHQVIELGGVKDVSNKNQRQVVLIGVSRKCDEKLEQKITGDKTQIWCTRVADRVSIASGQDRRSGDVEHEISKEILLRGKSGSGDQAVEGLNLVRETHEKVLLIGGVDDQKIILNNQVIKFGAGFNCKGSYDIVQEGNSFICKCVDSEETVKINYIGSSPTDVFISKKSELITNSAVDIQTSLNLYLGGKVNDILRERRVIEVIRNVTSRPSKTIYKEIRFEGITDSRVHRLIEIGLRRNCNGRWDKLVERDAVYIICRKAEKIIAVSGESGKPVLRERIVVQGQGHRGVDEISQQETVVLQGRGEERDEPVYTRNSTVLIQGQDKTEVDTEGKAETVVIQGSGVDQNIKTSVSNKTMVVQGKGVSSSSLESVQSNTIVIQGQGPEGSMKSRNKERVVLQGKESDAATESRQAERVVLQSQGTDRALESEVKRERIIVQGKASDYVVESKQSESIVVQGQGPYEAPESHVQNETVLVQGQGAPEIQESKHEYERIVVQGKGYDSEVESREKETFVLKGEGPYESLSSERETERIVLQGKGSDREETMQGETIIVQGQGGEKTNERKTIILQGGSTHTEGKNMQENKTIVLSGHGALNKNNSIILQGGGKMENEVVVVQGQGPDEEEQIKENRTLVLQGKATDIIQEVAKKNKTVVIQGKDAELKESEVRKEINKTVAVKGEGPEVIQKVQDRITLAGIQEQVVEELTSTVKPDVFVESVTLIGNMEEVTTKTEYVQSTTESSTKSSYDVEEISLGGLMQSIKKESIDETSRFGNIPKDIVRIVLVGNREYININQSHHLVELGSKARCDDGIKVTAENRRLSVKCVGAETGLDINYIGKEDTNIEIKTHARLEEITEKQSIFDKVYIHLGGFKQNVNNLKSGVIVPIRKNVSAVDEKVVYIRGIKDGLTENFVQVVDIGIRQTDCKDNSFGQYTNKAGTVVFCRRRADILPDEYDGESSTFNVKEVENELVVLTGSQIDIRNGSSNGVVNQVGMIDGEFIEGLSQPKEDLLFTVTSVNMSQGQTGTLDSSAVSRNQNKTFSSTLLQVIDKDISESFRVDNTSELDLGPSRGDLSIEEYDLSNGTVNQVGRLDGEFIEGLSEPEELQFTVTSVNVSQGQTGKLDSSVVFGNQNKTFSSTLLQVIDKDISETYRIDNTSDVDHGPSRGDLSIEDYEQDEARQDSASSSTYEKAFGSSNKQLNVEVNKTVDIKVGNDCTGKVEVFESDGQVIVKCTVGGDTFEINLVGLYRKSDEQITDKQVGTKSAENGQRAINTGNEVMLEAKGDIIPNHLLIQEVEYASPKRYIGEKGSKSNISVRKMALFESVRNHTLDEIPEINFIETATQSNHRRGDVPIDDYFSEDNDRPSGYQADSRNLHSTSYPHMRSSDRKWQNNIPSGIFGTRKYGIDLKYIDGKYDDLSIRGFQHALASDLKMEAQQNFNRAKYNIPSLKGSRLLKRIKTLKGFRSINAFRDEYISPKRQHDKLSKRFSRFDANISGFKYTSQRVQSDTSVDLIRQRDARYKSKGHAIKSVSGSRSSLSDSLMIDALNSGSALHAYNSMSGSGRNNEVQSNSGLPSKTKLGSVRSEASHQFGNIQTGLSLDSNIKSDVLLGGQSNSHFGGGNSINLFHTGHLKGQKGPCTPPFFNFGALSAEECIRCFCFGQTVQCFSSELQVSRIALASQLQFVRRDDDRLTPVEQRFVDFKPTTREYQVLDMTRALPTGSYYWSLPREFLGERLTSYGGELKYTIHYEIEGTRQRTTVDPDVIITGNGITLYYRGRTLPSPGIPTSISVPLIESAWERTDGPDRGDTPISEYASREDLMMVLENVETILIRGVYDSRQTTTRIGGVFMTTAVDYPTEYGRAHLVEECTCPTGYTGLSCQDCATGFTRVQSGDYLGQCVSCNCNGHSNDCDRITGQCLNCQHNTYGPECQLCQNGYYGDARRGTPQDCKPCPCPLTDPANQFSRTCFLDSDGEVTCGNCPEGYIGRQCERCAEGYVGDPMIPGSSCRKTIVDEYCDPRGSRSTRPNPITRRCECKENVVGDTCDSCKANTFYLSDRYELGCVECFCMGVSRTCQSTSWNRAQVGLSFTRDEAGVVMLDSNGNPVQDPRFTTNTNNRELVFRLDGLPDDTYYWSLPASFLGDKVTAYGGSLRFTVRYSSRQGAVVDNREPMVRISGNDITLVHRARSDAIQPNRANPMSVQMFEQNWYRSDGQPATREHLLMTLADLDAIWIRASFEDRQSETGIRDITLDVAEDRQTRQDRAYAVEQCVCPVGYRGLSCEDCDTGYTRSGGGLYLGLCEPCQCNGHSSECDPETGECRNCQHNTAGEFCDECAVGYYGDALRGTRSDCQKCPCPLTEAPNQFSPSCILDTDGQVTCTACPAGHTGRRCESCLQNYQGDPMRPGDYCKPKEEDRCDCDSRGTIPNTQCDANTLQCQCKPYVQGRRCARCREGHFYLEANNPQGCLTCFCSGITNQCTSSSYYRETIRPQVGTDGTHNFVLMNRRMNNIISDGFTVDAARNQVTFNGFEGVQRDRESLFFQLPPKFRGDQVASYGGYLRFTLEYSADQTEGRGYRDVDLEIISEGQALRLYYLFEPALTEGRSQTYEILLRESSFSDLRSNTAPTRETFMNILSDIQGFLIRATYHQKMTRVSIRDLSMDTAVATVTNLGGAPMVESCRCPEGYTGLSCQRCAQGYLRVSDGRGGLGRCVRCNCNGHATACDPDSGRCLNCQHNTEGDRCETCVDGYYGDATSGTPQDCRPCPCPLTTPQNQFSRTCYLDDDGDVTCDRCPTGYTGRNCGTCATGYTGNPTQPGGSCRPREEDLRPEVVVAPLRVEEPAGASVVFSCSVGGQGPFNVVWSRLDSRQLPDRATVSPRYDLSIRDLRQEDSGRYRCTATNAYGATRGDVELKVIYGEQPLRVEIDQTRVVLEEGRTARFVCTAYNFREMYILSWSKQGAVMPAKAVEQNGVLIIPNLQRSDQGNYVCTGSDMFSEDSASTILIIEEGPEPAPTVRIEPRFQTVREGEPVRFNCIATGSPPPTIEWYRGGNRPLNPEATVTSDGEFSIPRARPEDEADYYCKATNEAGTTELRTILYVTRDERPPTKVLVRESRVVTLIGQTARLECYSEDPERTALFWSRQNAALPPRSSQEEGILTIPNVQPPYAGNYICTGTDTSTGVINTAVTRLDVESGRENTVPTVKVEPEKLTIPMGTTGTLRCIASGSPEPQVTWLKSREDLASNHQVTGNTLRITQATMGDRGIYVCRAENVAGTDQDWAIVEVERRMRPKIDLYPNATQRVRTGASAMFQCRVMDGDPPPAITWSRVGNLPMDPEKVEIMDNGVIMFKQITSAQQGSYLCTATNDMGTITATASLIVEGPPSITLQPSQTVYALIGQRVTLECIAEGDPTPSVYWIEPSQPRRGDLAPDGVLYDVYEGSAILDIANVGREDQGYYTCVATNTGGRTEDSLQLIVQEGGSPSVSIAGPSTLSVQEGQQVELVCSADAIRNPVIRWRRREGALPPDHRVSGGVLRIGRFRQEYAGEYICSTVIPEGTYEASVFIIVSVAPRLSISPQRVTTRAGESIQLRCSPQGGGPFNIEWSKTEGQINPRATERDGILEIRQVTAADAGRYRCTVTTSLGGTLDGYATVEVEVPPTVTVRQREKQAERGTNVELRCDVTGSPTPAVRWTKDGGELPDQHRVQDGVLTIYNVQPDDRGRYICTASSSAGSARDYTYLDIRSGPVIERPDRPQSIDSQVVNVGDRVSMECIVTGTPLPTVTWSRDDGPLPDDAILGEGILIIPSAKIEDAGTYTCLAVNEAGSVSSKFILYVRARPLINAPQRVTSAALGDSVTLGCDASGYPTPDITWRRKDGEMPDDYTVIDGDLLISRVRPEDAGTYVCSAVNEYGQSDTPVELSVGALVPYFTQTPESYISYPPLNDVYLDFDILLSLKPESTEGMVLYNGQFNDGGGDFVCFGLSEGYPEFRFDVGSGPAVIRGNKTLDLNEWHTVKLTRNRKKGTMVVNEQPAYTGESPGYFTGLDLSEPMYLGSVPNYDSIPRVAGFREGFVGAVSEVKLKGVSMNLGAEALEVVGVEQYNACRDRPCANNGACAPFNVKYGFRCMCPQGYAGERCEQRGESCYPGACGPKGRCYNLDGGLAGFRCVCPLGKTGTGCQMDINIINPAFNQTSFISYPPAEDALFAMNIYLEYKPYSLRDGIILYEGNNRDGSGDFMAILQKDGYLEFRFDTGSGPAIVRSRNPLRVNEWTRVTASRKNRDGQLIVNGDEPVTGTSPGSTVGLNLKLPMYLGGPDPTATLSSSAGATIGFIGCVAELSVNDIKIDLINDAIESYNVVDCGERRLCERQPCENNAVCEDLPGPDYRCLCPSSHTGKNCEAEINVCLTNSPCRNGAPCSITDDGYRCDCPLGFEGINCENAISLNRNIAVEGDGFIEFDKDYLPHLNTQERQTISFTIKTTQSDGLIFWQGEPEGRPLRGGDHFSIGLKGGYVDFSYEMGSGPAMIMSLRRVDDGQEHSITVSKLGRTGSLTVDNEEEVTGESQGFLQMLNADGNIFIGGVSLIDAMTDGKYSENFKGCIGNIVIQGKGPLELPQDAIQGYNVKNCDL